MLRHHASYREANVWYSRNPNEKKAKIYVFLSLYSLEEAEENFRRKQITTTYQFYHGGYSVPKENKKNVFEFKSLDKVIRFFNIA